MPEFQKLPDPWLYETEALIADLDFSRRGPGRLTLYKPATVEKFLAALSAGLTHKQACLACGISQSTLIDWRERYPDLDARMEAAREIALQTALEGIKTAGDKDWRALAEWLKLTFPEYRQGNNINISATATSQQAVVCDEATRERLIALRERITLADRGAKKLEASPPASVSSALTTAPPSV